MVHRGTTEAFTTRFRGAGFRAEAMLPVYGLAEAGLAVAFPCLGRGVKSVRVRRHALGEGVVEPARPEEANTREVVSVGRPVDGLEIALLGADGERLSESRVGELLVPGPPVMVAHHLLPPPPPSPSPAR